MANQSNRYTRSYYPYSILSLFYLITFIVFIQGPTIIAAQSSQYQSVIASNNNINNRNPRLGSSVMSTDDTAPDEEADIYDDNDAFEEEDPSASSQTSVTQLKFTPNITSHRPAQVEEVDNPDYEDEADTYQNYANDDNHNDDKMKQDDSQIFGDTVTNNEPDLKPEVVESNKKKPIVQSSTNRMPFMSETLWRDLFARPGILVGIIGGIVIGMLSAILLVMFVIYRMRKKDEGSYALEEGPRKSPSHAYTRVSSREFFA